MVLAYEQAADPAGDAYNSRSQRHDAIRDFSKIAGRGSPAHDSQESTPRPVEHQLSAAELWLERKPADFLRHISKQQKMAASMPSLVPAPAGSKKGVPAPRKGRKSDSIHGAASMVEAQQRADDAKKEKELADAERHNDRERRAHSILVSERVRKEAERLKLTSVRDEVAAKYAAWVDAGDALRKRLEALQRESDELFAELDIEEATTPRYEHMLKRAEAASLAAADRCARPEREKQALIDEMRRCGDSHLSAQLDAESLVREQAKLTQALRTKANINSQSLAELHFERSESKAGRDAVIDIMKRKHNDSLMLSGDMDSDMESSLQESAASTSGVQVAAGSQKYFSREHAFELTTRFNKLADFFSVDEPEELVAKILKMWGSSSDEKAEQLQADIDGATNRKHELEEEITRLEAEREETRFAGGEDTVGYAIWSADGKLEAYGGSEEVIENGELIVNSQERETTLRVAAMKAEQLTKAAAACTDMLMEITQVIADRMQDPREAKRAAQREAELAALRGEVSMPAGGGGGGAEESEEGSTPREKPPPPPPPKPRRLPVTPERAAKALEDLGDRLLSVTGEYGSAYNNSQPSKREMTPEAARDLTSRERLYQEAEDSGLDLSELEQFGGVGGVADMFANLSALMVDFENGDPGKPILKTQNGERILGRMPDGSPLFVPSWSRRPSTSGADPPTAAPTVASAKNSRSQSRQQSRQESRGSKQVSSKGSRDSNKRGSVAKEEEVPPDAFEAVWPYGSFGGGTGLLPPVPGAEQKGFSGSASMPILPTRKHVSVNARLTTEDILQELAERGIGAEIFAGKRTGGPSAISSVVDAQMHIRNARDSKNIRVRPPSAGFGYPAIEEEGDEDDDESSSRPGSAGMLSRAAVKKYGRVRAGAGAPMTAPAAEPPAKAPVASKSRTKEKKLRRPI